MGLVRGPPPCYKPAAELRVCLAESLDRVGVSTRDGAAEPAVADRPACPCPQLVVQVWVISGYSE